MAELRPTRLITLRTPKRRCWLMPAPPPWFLGFLVCTQIVKSAHIAICAHTSAQLAAVGRLNAERAAMDVR